jgi:hypothetical protein
MFASNEYTINNIKFGRYGVGETLKKCGCFFDLFSGKYKKYIDTHLELKKRKKRKLENLSNSFYPK